MSHTRYLDIQRAVLAAHAGQFIQGGVPGLIALERSDYGVRINPEEHDKGMLERLDDPEMRRILFSTQQALTFTDVGGGPEPAVLTKLHLPFECFWLEFTDLLAFAEPEPKFPNERLRAFYIGPTSLQIPHDVPYRPYQAVAFVSEGVEEAGEQFTVADRGFQYDIHTGFAMVSVASVTNNPDPSRLPERLATAGDRAFFIAGQHDGYAGWYERIVLQYGELLSWLLAYMMAKGIEIVEEPLPRAERRRAMRAGLVPTPWHIVRIEPHLLQGLPEGTGSGARHSYRYDVMGHLRFGRHRRGDGTYSHTIEWVRPHQRGLSNAVYVPATRKVEAGRSIDPIMREYWHPDS